MNHVCNGVREGDVCQVIAEDPLNAWNAEVGEVVKIKSIEVDAEIGARALVARLDAPDAFIAPKYLRPFVSTT
jgi:hypothetical protein